MIGQALKAIAADLHPPPRTEALTALAAILHRRTLERSASGIPVAPDPGWMMILALVIARDSGTRLPVSALCARSGLPRSTAYRSLLRLEDRGLVERTGDPGDHRRVRVALTRRGHEAATAELRAILSELTRDLLG